MLKKISDEKIEELKVVAAEYLIKEFEEKVESLNEGKMALAIKVLELK